MLIRDIWELKGSKKARGGRGRSSRGGEGSKGGMRGFQKKKNDGSRMGGDGHQL